MNIIQYTVKIQ